MTASSTHNTPGLTDGDTEAEAENGAAAATTPGKRKGDRGDSEMIKSGVLGVIASGGCEKDRKRVRRKI